MIEKQHQLINLTKSYSLLHKPTLLSFMSATKKPKGFSFSAFLFFSLFIFFFLSHVSPSTLFKDTNFWFILSNAIILAVAADSGAFSSSEQKLKHDLYEEFLINSTTRSRSSSTTTAPPLLLNSQITKVIKEEEEAHDDEEPMKENAVVDDQAVEVPNEKDMNIGMNSGKKVVISVVSSDDQVKRTCTTASTLRRSKTEKLEKGSDHEEVDEFSAMSVEELNKRVEEFIQKFNREIRLQETQNYLG